MVQFSVSKIKKALEKVIQEQLPILNIKQLRLITRCLRNQHFKIRVARNLVPEGV